MAEQIGSIEYDISINDINSKKVLKEVADQIKKTEEAAAGASQAIDNAAGTIVDAGKAVEKETGKVSDAAKTAAKEEEKLADTLAETASVAEAAAAAQEEFVESIDTAAVADLNDTLAEAAETTTNLTEATAGNATAAADFANELYDLTLQTLELIKNGETESELYDELKGKITDLLNANKDYADNPPFSEEQTESLREYKDELVALYDEINTASTVEETAAEIGETVAQAAEDAADKTETLSKKTKGNSAAAKENGTVWNYIGNLFKVKLPAGATAAKLAIESLKMALTAGLLTVITMLSEAITKLIDKLTFGFRVQGELNKQVAESTGDAIANLKSLQGQWNALGDDMSAKQKFILENKSAFDKLGVSIKSVNEAERLLVTHTQQFISAIMARARASAAQGMIIKATQDSVEDLAEAESEFADAQQKHDEWYARYNSIIEQAKSDGVTVRLNSKNYLQTTAGKYTKALQQAQRELGITDVQMSKAKEKRDKLLAEIDEQTKGFQKIVVNSNAAADELFRASGVDEAAALKNYKAMLDDRKAAYKDYASFLNSTNAEIRANAADIADINVAEGKNYLQWLLNEKRRLESAIADPNDDELDINRNKYNMLMKEIAAQTQLAKKQQEELTHYEQLKALLKEYEAAKGKGYYDPTIINNLKEQIRLFEERNNLVELPQEDYSAKIAKYREFAEKLVEIERKRRAQTDAVDENRNLNLDQQNAQIGNINSFADSDIELLKSEYGIYGEDIGQAVIDGMNTALKMGEADLVARIIDLREKLASLQTDGNGTDNAAEIAKLSAALMTATNAYSDLKANADAAAKSAADANDAITDKEGYVILKRSINDCAQSFKNIGQEIGGAAGESLEFLGDLTANVMGTITAIETYAASTSKTIEGVGKATAAAIRTVEAASVILAIISAAMQVAMALVDMFKKDEETYDEKKQVYDAYIDTLDTLIERERKLTETLSAQDAVAHFSKIKKYYEDKIKVEREAAQAYLESGASWRSHSEGYKANENLSVSDWHKIVDAIWKGEYGDAADSTNYWRKMEIADAVGFGNYKGDVSKLLELSADELKNLQTNAYEVYAKLPAEMRSAIDSIIEADEALQQLKDDQRAQATGTSRDTFVDALKDSLLDLDVTAEKVSQNIHEYLRKGLVLDFYKKQMQDDVNKYYKIWADFMDDGDITDAEQSILDAKEKELTDRIAGIEKINEKFKTADEEEDEKGLSGAIKNASQESIDLLAGQTNAVRMNQVEGMALARESLNAVMAIHVQVTLCAEYLRTINSAVNSPGSDRAQGII